MMTELDLRMPLLAPDSASTALEEKVLRQQLTLAHLHDQVPPSDAGPSRIAQLELDTDRTILQIIQGACKSDRLTKALDATKWLCLTQSLEAASKIAAFFSIPNLEDRIEELKVSAAVLICWVSRI